MYWLAIISSRVSPPLFCHCCSIGVLQLTFPPSPGHCPYNFLATFPDSMFWNLFISFLPPPSPSFTPILSCFHCLVCKGAEPKPQEDNMVEQQFPCFLYKTFCILLYLHKSAVVSKQIFLEYFMNYAFSSSELNDGDPVLSSFARTANRWKTSITALVKVWKLVEERLLKYRRNNKNGIWWWAMIRWLASIFEQKQHRNDTPEKFNHFGGNFYNLFLFYHWQFSKKIPHKFQSTASCIFSIYKWIYIQLKSIILRMWKIMLHILVHRYILQHHSECTSTLLCSFTCMWFEFVCACILSQTLCWIYWAVSFYWYWEIFRGKLPHLVLLHTPNQITH